MIYKPFYFHIMFMIGSGWWWWMVVGAGCWVAGGWSPRELNGAKVNQVARYDHFLYSNNGPSVGLSTPRAPKSTEVFLF